MKINCHNNNNYYLLFNDKTTFIVIRDFNFDKDKIDIKGNTNLSLVFDFENLSIKLEPEKVAGFINYIKSNNNAIRNIIIKNCLVTNKDKKKEDEEEVNEKKINEKKKIKCEESPSPVEKISNFFDNIKLDLDLLYISDELYSMSPNLNILFGNVSAKKLILKKIKINSKSELNKFFEFISKIKCEELDLEDIFIELIIKEDKDYNDLEKYITFENGKFNVINFEKELKVKKLKMIDCPLFDISQDIFKNISDDIAIDIDENSIINPDIITKLKINEGYFEICYDLDSFKLNDNEENQNNKDKKIDYLKYFEYIFNTITKDNIKFKKIKFKNFDMTKYEYITGENLTFIEEKNLIFNKEERERKTKFEEFDKKINERIKNWNNINNFKEIKELIFDNCSNYFIQLILKLILNNKNNLEYLKLKKCGKEYFDIINILSLKLNKLILFDIPLKLEKFPEKDKLGKIINLTIGISCLEHYCKINDLDYYKTMEIIVQLITNKNYNRNLCFEMNALPSIMTFLAAKEYEKISNPESTYKTIPPYFDFIKEDIGFPDLDKKKEIFKKAIEKRNSLVKESFKLKGLNENTTIKLKRNNIKNRLENYEYFYYNLLNQKNQDLERGKNLKSDFGKDVFDIDKDYKYFFYYNGIKDIILENCLFTNFRNSQNIELEKEETIINFIHSNSNKNYVFDMLTLNEIFFGNKASENITILAKYLSIKNFEEISIETFEYLINLTQILQKIKRFFSNFALKKIEMVFHNIKEKKEFFCLLSVFDIISEKDYFLKKFYEFNKKKNKYEPKPINDDDKRANIRIADQKKLIEKIGPYFLKKKDENGEDIYSNVFNYYYTSEEEKNLFGDFENSKNNKKEIESYKQLFISIEYKFEDQWDIIMK